MKPGVFIAHLLKLEDHLFLDLFPDNVGVKEMDRIDVYKLHLVPAHTFLKVHQIAPQLQLGALNPEWLSKLLKKDPTAIQHAKGGFDNDAIILTAPTPDLQKFVLQHVNTPDAFGDPAKLNRVEN